VCIAAFLAGGLNSLAGGGSFITLPALLYAGITPVLANTTSAAVLLPGYLGSVMGFKNTFSTLNLKKLMPLLALTIIFSIGGAYLLINSSDEFFLQFIPFLILIATLLFIFNPTSEHASVDTSANLSQKIGLSIVSTYGGYFNGGLGIALLSVLSLGNQFSLKQMSAVKSLISFLITTVSVSVFLFNGFIVWSYVLYMVLFSVLGGFAGAKLTEILPAKLVRKFIILAGLSLSASLIFIGYIK
jgi:uncharacterized membrane protein YfcA